MTLASSRFEPSYVFGARSGSVALAAALAAGCGDGGSVTYGPQEPVRPDGVLRWSDTGVAWVPEAAAFVSDLEGMSLGR